MKLNIEIDEFDAGVKWNGSKMEVELRGCELREILDQIDIKDVIQHYGESDFLDEIGKDECMTHFDLIEDTE